MISPGATDVIGVLDSVVGVGGVGDNTGDVTIVVSAGVDAEVIPSEGSFRSSVGWRLDRIGVTMVVASGSCLVTNRSFIT